MSHPVRVLAVEDDALNRQLLRASLAQAKDRRLSTAEIVEATTVAEARRALIEQTFDVLLLDRRLPDGDGFVLAGELAAATHRPVIVALTADAVPATESAAYQAGCDVVMTKPYRPAELQAALSRQLDKAAQT